jgi:hypothetical protein
LSRFWVNFKHIKRSIHALFQAKMAEKSHGYCAIAPWSAFNATVIATITDQTNGDGIMPTGEQTQGAAWARALLRWAGWRIQFSGLPVRKGVIIAYPHTSNWDFIVGILFKWGTGVQLHFWAKEGLFRGLSRYTLGPLMRRWARSRWIAVQRTA